jgi:hypothetical protein
LVALIDHVLHYDLLALNDPAEAAEHCVGYLSLIRPNPGLGDRYLKSDIPPFSQWSVDSLKVDDVTPICGGKTWMGDVPVEKRCCLILYSHQDWRFGRFR